MTNTTKRNTHARQILSERQRAIQNEVHGRMRDGRTDRPSDVRDDLELSDGDIQSDVDLALLQMRAETLVRINEALGRLDAGGHGACSDCAGKIPQRRLHAQPFAVRCLQCEERRERRGRAGQAAERRVGVSLFGDAVNS
jgi:DnaK suppressor protein